MLIPDPGVKKAPDPGSGSATPDFEALYKHCILRGSAHGKLVFIIDIFLQKIICYFLS
jgi:hypothetical protein